MDCGPLTVEFYNDDAEQTELDVSIFSDERSDSINHLTILPASTESIKEGQYMILYRIFYEEYPDVVVEQTQPFTVTITNPCASTVHNMLSSPQLQA